MRKPWLPFKFMPASWGLKGDTYDEAEANYNLAGEELDRRLVAIRYKNDANELFLRQLEIDVKYNKLTPYDAAIKRAQVLNKPDTLEYDLAILEVEHKFGNIGKTEYAKRCATAKNEPWVSFIDSGFDPKQGIDGVFFELDWNPQWVDYLKLHGFVGHTEEDVVEDWFSEVCKSYAQQDGTVSSLPVPFSIIDKAEK